MKIRLGTRIIVAFCCLGFIPFSTDLSAQQLNVEDKRQKRSGDDSQDVKGTILLNGKELSFSSIEELEAITLGLSQKKKAGSTSNGKVALNYFELNANDLDSTKTFYSSAFGFKFQDYGSSYATVTSGPIAIGFVRGSTPSAPMPAFQTFDIEASMKAVINAKGKIEKSIFNFPGGKRFEFLDPSGNRIAVFENN